MGFTRPVNTKTKNVYVMISPRKLRPHPRNEILFGANNTNYEQLRQSIISNGFLEHNPIVCCKNKEGYTIICGHRRWRIAMELSLTEIPMVVKHIADEDIERCLIEDNLKRAQEARSYSYLERFIMALQLRSLRQNKRGGDRRSPDFCALNSDQRWKNEIAETVGLGSTYLRYYSVVANKILTELTNIHSEILFGKEPHEQLRIVIEKKLSTELTDLASDKRSIVKLYQKYRTPKNISLKIANVQHTGETQSGPANFDTTIQNYPISEVQIPTTQASTVFVSLSTEVNDICKALNAIEVAALPQQSIKMLRKTIDILKKKIQEIKKASNTETKEKKELTLPLFAVKTGLSVTKVC